MSRAQGIQTLLSRIGSALISWSETHISHFKRIIVVVTVILLGIVLFLGWTAARKVREVVIEDFNAQQLVLAKHASSQIENNLNLLKRELFLLGQFPAVQYGSAFLRKHMEITFLSIKDEAGLEIRYIEGNDIAHLMDKNGYRKTHPYYQDVDALKWASKEENTGKIIISDVSQMFSETESHKLTVKIITPVWQVSIDESYPVAKNKFSGVLIFLVDAEHLSKKVMKDIRSGKTGYAWIINNKGIFLYHPEDSFINKNAFEARSERKPAISFAKINEIQKEKMLKGHEGTSWYISGWHGGREGTIKKLIAYAPVNLLDGNIWSVAVVAPVSEVEDAIHSIQIRQFLLEGIVILVILLGGFMMFGIMIRWSSSLNIEVANRTRELKKSRDQYRSLIENANDIIFTLDRDGLITAINRSGISFFGKNKEDIIGQNIGEICFNEESAALQLKTLDEVFYDRANKNIVYTIRIKNEEYWLNTNFSLLFDEYGEPYAVLGISRDITADKKRAIEQQMYHTEKLASMGTLAAGVAHEINNPLALILGFSDMLLEKATPDSSEYELLRIIEKHAMNAKRVVENLLSFARYTEQKEEFIEINMNIETVLAVIENTLKLNNIVLVSRLQDDLPKAEGDAGEIQQVFLNIMNNAIHAMKGGGILTITTSMPDKNKVEIRFADTGHGISKEHRSRIFDPLFTTKIVGEGTGLGLSVSYGIITKYGGTITFETRTRDESEVTGTTFIITLPVINIAEDQ